MPDPIQPTRVIPAGEWPPLGPTPLPPRAPGPADVPPWRAPAAPPAAPPPPVPPAAGRPWPWPEPPAGSGPLHIHVTVDLVPPAPEPEPPRRNWAWLWRWLRPRQSLIGITLALLPSPAYEHYSLTTAWATCLNDLRANGAPGDLGTAYLMAGAAVGFAVLIDHRRQTWWARCLLVVTLIGGTGALGWYDPVTVVTGVRP
ncbi:hypothetical protein AB0F42_24385 [Streptomyces buecherae]|uniref:hypothetical protein n=1 Tax=Streptomyces buecherae TaxID=2763006 RepID=UPI00340F5B39